MRIEATWIKNWRVVARLTRPSAISFEGFSRVDRHRRINEALAEELRHQILALALTTLAPNEAAKRM